MTRSEASLQGRLMLWGAVLTAVSIISAGLMIAWILERFVVGQIDGQLDARTAAIADLIADKGADDVGKKLQATFDPPFDRPQSGWFWQIVERTPTGWRNVVGSNSPDAIRDASLDRLWNEVPSLVQDSSRPIDALTERGIRVHARARSETKDDRSYYIIAAAPRAAILGALWQLIWPVAICILLLGIAMTGAIALQVKWGLRPLRDLEADIAKIRSGGIDRLPVEQPRELRALVKEINQLIDQSDQGLTTARRQVANLAHSLKTPLAFLKLELAEGRIPERPNLLRPVDQIESSLRYHLNRAKTNALTGAIRQKIQLSPVVADLIGALQKLFAGRNLQMNVDVKAPIEVVCEPTDLNEILGNVLENACKWAGSQVALTADVLSDRVRVSIDDDGPGIPDGKLGVVLKPGERLDTLVRGDGFGLSIAQELIELHGGSIELSRSPLGGLRATLTFRGSGYT
jgi:signal transduction histidine kinase